MGDAHMTPGGLEHSILEIAIQVADERGVALTVDQIDRNRSLRDYGLDSMDLIAFVSDIEDRFDLSLPNEGLEKAQCIGDLIDLVQQQLTVAGR